MAGASRVVTSRRMSNALLIAMTVVVGPAGLEQRPLDAKEIAEYRLTEPVLRQFVRATRAILAATRHDPRFIEAPLFTRDITVSGDAAEAAATLQKRLDADPVLAGALFAADLDAREYAKFALTLFGAHLAHGFMESGALRRVPPGVATENILFVKTHKNTISPLLREMGLE